MVYKVFITLYGRKLQFSTNAENRLDAEKKIIEKIMRDVKVDEVRPEMAIPDVFMEIFGMFK